MSIDPRSETILTFWFGSRDDPAYLSPKSFWFEANDTFDATLRERFSTVHRDAMAGRFDVWAETPADCLALLILFDQFSRNMFRGTAAAFSSDPRAKSLAVRIREAAWDAELAPVQQLFAYLPFEHSESLADQRTSVALFEGMKEHEHKPEWIDYAQRHLRIIERFGRFPHRNAILGRESTPEEIAFLKEPGSGF